MDEDRSLGVTEAKFALTMVICVLVAIGYFVLSRLGSTGESTIEVRPQVVSPPAVAHQEPAAVDENQPRVLPLEPEGATEVRTTQRLGHTFAPAHSGGNGAVQPVEFERR